MKRGADLVAMALMLGACGASTSKLPATYALLRPPKAAAKLAVWGDSQGRLTFHGLRGPSFVYYRYDPKTFELSQFTYRGLDSVVTYESARAAWAEIRSLYHVDESDVTSALASGEPSREPPLVTRALSRHLKPNSRTTLYGTDFGKMAAATGLVIPRLKRLGGLSLKDLYRLLPQDLNYMVYGLVSEGKPNIALHIMRDDHGRPDLPMPVNANGYARIAGTRYAIQDCCVIFPYRGEWIQVAPFGVDLSKSWASIVRAIVTAPTVG